MKYLIKNIYEFDNDYINDFLHKCNENDIDYINNIKNTKKKKQTIVGRILLSILLKENYNIDFSNITLKYNQNGKPYIYNSNIFFNISHSDNLVICAISNAEIGVDIEKIKNIKKNYIDIFLTQEEKDYVNYPNKNYHQRFFRIFTQKEAYIKMFGGSILKNKFNSTYKNIKYKNIETFDNYIISICWKT